MAELEPKSNRLPFQTARARLSSRYQISLETDDFIERGYYVWRDIGNIATETDSFTVQVPVNGVVELPSNCEFVEAVTSHEDVTPDTLINTTRSKYQTNSGGYKQDSRPDKSATSIEDNVRASKSYQYGTSVNYTTGDGHIVISSPAMYNRLVTVRFSAIAKDDEGLPLLNEKEVHAIAANLALQEGEKKLFQGMKGADVLVQYLKLESDRLLQAAKTPERITDDELDKALDIKTSWDRKVYGKRFNLIT